MKKIFIQGISIVVAFLVTWYALQQINWMKLFKVEKITAASEEKLGEIFWEIFKNTEKENKDTVMVLALDTIVTKICERNELDRKNIKIHILESNEVNAFALPDGHLVVYTGLLNAAENPEEVAGVLGHELGHIAGKHVLNKLIREVGLNTLITISAGSAGGEIIKKAAKHLSSTAFDRALEKEADIKSVDYLIQSDIDPMPFADFLERLAEKENEYTKYANWLSTHPDSKERAAYIRAYAKGKGMNSENTALLSKATWNQIHHQH